MRPRQNFFPCGHRMSGPSVGKNMEPQALFVGARLRKAELIPFEPRGVHSLIYPSLQPCVQRVAPLQRASC